MIAFLCGCIVSLCAGDDAGMAPLLPGVNALFIAGSTALLMDAMYAWFLRIRSSKAVSARQRILELLDVLVAIAFCVAATVGGFGNHSWLVTTGMFFWSIGSVLLLLEPFLALSSVATASSRQDCSSVAAPPESVIASAVRD
mmetsp:Transcript_10794/g.33269  ORF Transcript_10794/g.33269 Transcript_10794/m.33269 type:complete len:142 (+) Transcript_10794:313-738(+)